MTDRCPECHGRGWVWYYFWFPQCPVCEGTGRRVVGNVCHRCRREGLDEWMYWKGRYECEVCRDMRIVVLGHELRNVKALKEKQEITGEDSI